MISLLDFIHPALPGPNLTHSRWGTIWPYAGRNHGHKMRHKWPPVGSLRWPSTRLKVGDVVPALASGPEPVDVLAAWKAEALPRWEEFDERFKVKHARWQKRHAE